MTEVDVRADDGLLLAAYPGDVSGDRAYTSLDFSRMNRVLLRIDTGFGAYPLIDPVIIGDVQPNGVLQAGDALRIGLRAGGAVVPDIPPIPTSLVNAAPVAGNDAYALEVGQVLTVGAAGVLANDSDADGDSFTVTALDTTGTQGMVVIAPDGGFVFTPNAGFTGNTSFTYKTSDFFGASSASGTVQLNVTTPTLRVLSMTPTDSGLRLRFDRALDSTVLNLYSGAPTNLGAADLVLASLTDGKSVPGSIVLDDDRRGLTFVRTGGALAPDRYALTLAARANGVVADTGVRLDGNDDGTPGDDYISTFTVPAVRTATLGVGEIARGPGQALAIAASGFRFPIAIADAAGATSINFTLRFDPALLTVTGMSPGTLPAGSTVVVDTGTAGEMRVTITTSAALDANKFVLGYLLATVPAAAPYGAKQVLELTGIAINGGTINARADDGLHVVAFVGDTSGDGSYSTLDFQRINRVLLNQDNGFGQWPLVDPVVIGDVQPNGRLQTADALRIGLRAGGASVADIPEIPVGLPPLTFAGADPMVTVGTVTAAAGAQVSVPVFIDIAAGLESVVLTVRYDESKLSFLGVDRTPLTQGFTHLVVRRGAGEITVDGTALTPVEEGSGELFRLRFAVAPGAEGTQALDLVSVRLNDTWLTVLPKPVAGPDVTDGAVIVAPPAAAAAGARKSSARGPMLAMTPEQGGGRGFALAQRGDVSWLNEWVADPTAPAAKAGQGANAWTISARANDRAAQ